MYRKPLLFALCVCTLIACKKDKDDDDDPVQPPGGGAPTIGELAPLAIGNYWVFERYYYDQLGNETNTGLLDSLAVVGDTTVNGNTAFVLEGTRQVIYNQPYHLFMRDSADCLVGLYGGIIFTLSDPGQVYSVTGMPPGPTIAWSVDPTVVTHTVPAGTWPCHVINGLVEQDGYPSRVIHSHRGEGIGLVQEESVYLDSPGCGFRHKLVRFHLQ